MTTLIIIVLSSALWVYLSNKVRTNQNKKPTIPEGLSSDLQVVKKQLEAAYPNNEGFITNIARGSIDKRCACKMIRMHFADGFKYVQLKADANVYCVERKYVEDETGENDYELVEFYTKWGNLLSYFAISPNSHCPSPFRACCVCSVFNLLPRGYSFKRGQEPGDLLYK